MAGLKHSTFNSGSVFKIFKQELIISFLLRFWSNDNIARFSRYTWTIQKIPSGFNQCKLRSVLRRYPWYSTAPQQAPCDGKGHATELRWNYGLVVVTKGGILRNHCFLQRCWRHFLDMMGDWWIPMICCCHCSRSIPGWWLWLWWSVIWLKIEDWSSFIDNLIY